MNIATVRENIKKVKGKDLKFKFNGSRNQTEEFDGRIVETYRSIFIIHSDTDNRVKSFSYSDVLVDNLEIFDK